MRWKRFTTQEWRRWFAWRPVKTGDIIDPIYVWLEWVERCPGEDFLDFGIFRIRWEYRSLEEEEKSNEKT